MGQSWNGQDYNMDWEPLGPGGVVTGPKDWAASNANPQQASSPWAQSSTTQTSAPTTSPWGQGVRDKLTTEMNLPSKVDTTDPAYQQAIEANRFTADRTADRQRAATAQRMAAQGTLTGGGLDTAVQRIVGDQGAQEQGFEAALMGQYRQQNLDRAARGLQLGTGLLGQDEERALRQLLTQQGYGLQRDLASDDLEFRRDALGQQLGLGEAQLNQDAMLALLRGGK